MLAAAKREKNGRYLERKKRGEGAHSRFSLLLPTFQGPTTRMGEDFFKEEEGHTARGSMKEGWLGTTDGGVEMDKYMARLVVASIAGPSIKEINNLSTIYFSPLCWS